MHTTGTCGEWGGGEGEGRYSTVHTVLIIVIITSDVLQHKWRVSHCAQVIHTR